MIVKDLIKDNSAYGSIACIRDEEYIVKVQGYIGFNFDFIKQFSDIIITVNWLDGVTSEIVERYLGEWQMAFPNSNVHTIQMKENKGHTLGFMEMDNSLFNFCKKNNIKWLFKSTEDVIIQQDFLDKEVDEADFYYFNGIGYGGMVKYNFDFDRIIKEDFYPNTNFYILNTEKIDYLYDEEMITEAFDHISSIKDYSGRIWEYLPGFSCEGKLAEIVEGLTKYHLLSGDKYKKLLHAVRMYQIHDNAHKNILLEGVCHFHNTNEPVIII